MWKIPEDTIPTYFLMRYGPELRRLENLSWDEMHSSLIAGSQAQRFIREKLTELLDDKYRIAMGQVGSSNMVWKIGFQNMQTLLLIQSAKMRRIRE